MECKKNLAVIPARSGSKGLKDKNIKELCGKPLIAYTIEAAINSKIFDEVFVSTDSDAYAEIARKYGAKVPFLREEILAKDNSSTWDVVKNSIEVYKKIGYNFETVTILQPTSPLRTYEDIVNGYNLFIDKKANFVVSVCEMEHSPLWSGVLPDNLNMNDFIDKGVVDTPRQLLPQYYRLNGALYIAKCSELDKVSDIYNSNCFAYIMSKKKSIDIDDEYDFEVAEALMNKNWRNINEN